MIPWLFAYGTLVTGALDPEVADLMRAYCRPGPSATVPGRLLDLGSYPGAVKGMGTIRGQLIQLLAPKRCLALLDRYEDYSPAHPQHSLYVRELVRARTLAGRWQPCWMYWLRESRGHAIPSGDWRAHCGS